MKIVELGAIRNLLTQWEKVRESARRGRIHGFAICLKDHEGNETVYFGGDYQEDPDAALRVALTISTAINKRELPRPPC